MVTIDKMAEFEVSYEYTGHVNYSSPYGCADDCGNCDGAKCEWCHKSYVTRFDGARFSSDYEAALNHAKQYRENLSKNFDMWLDTYNSIFNTEETLESVLGDDWSGVSYFFKYSYVERMRRKFAEIKDDVEKQGLFENMLGTEIWDIVKKWLECGKHYIDVGDWWDDSTNADGCQDDSTNDGWI